MSKLWQKGVTLDSLMEKFSVGNDYLLDSNLVLADVLGSIAHGRTLLEAGILNQEELKEIETALSHIAHLHQKGEFSITVSDEDCHTAIENFLVKEVGEAGKKIHSGRSRNDQVQTALRVWMREFSLSLALKVNELTQELFTFAQKYQFVPMPGRTHMQLAMPSSVGLWAASFAEELLDETKHLLFITSVLDQSPLGSAASYGTPLPLDREFSATVLGFAKVQNNVLYANNSRGKFEAMLLDSCDYITLTLSKIAQDLMIFTLEKLNYFTLPEFLCTGSSIMPQKKNPDGLELIRSRSALVSASSMQVKSIIRSLPSGYNRDFQDTKEPLFRGTLNTHLATEVMLLLVENLEVNEEALLAGFNNEIFATDEVLQKVMRGDSFRTLYKEVGAHLESVKEYDPYQIIRERSSVGTSGNLNLESFKEETLKMKHHINSSLEKLTLTYKRLTPTIKNVVAL